ncbi:MAG: hypothetical protein ATN35_03190 [Epulopiscium sp. Nele67-Bin004]|nr:MAG: hypothetical protein ATN35_03190 [Epulopiscium sp. Nele67-Bin004]
MIASQFHEITTFLDKSTEILTEVQSMTITTFPEKVATPITKKIEVLQELLELIETSNMNSKLLVANLRHALIEAGIILVKLTDALNVDTVETYQILEKLATIQIQLATAKKKVGDDLTGGTKVIND